MASKRATKKGDADVIVGYKGFNADWTCRGMRYEVGKTYTHDGNLSLCRSGLHFCENPMDVWSYYPLALDHPIAEVEARNVSDERSTDSKRVAGTLTVKAAIDIAGIVRAAVEWTRKAAGADDNIAAASWYGSNLAASGNDSRLAASGNDSSLAASGYYSSLAASGYYSRLAASGKGSRLAASGYGSRLAASGYYSSLAASGYGSSLAASGNGSRLAASGNDSRLAASGRDSVVMAAGIGSTASAGPDGAIALVWDDGKRLRIAVGYAGENGIEDGVPYRADSAGNLVPA